MNHEFLLIINERGTERIPIYTKGTRNWTDSYAKETLATLAY